MARVKRGVRSQAIRNYLKNHPQAGPKDVVDGLQAEGVTVSKNLVSAIKYGKRSGTAPRSGRTKISASEYIRRELAKNPDAGPKVIREELARQGIKVTTGLVSFVKFNFRRSNRKASAARPVMHSAARRTKAPVFRFEHLVEVKRVAESLGGPQQLRRALEMLAQLA